MVWYYVVGGRMLMSYIVGFVSILVISCALQEPAKTPIGSIVQTSAEAVSGIARDGGFKKYMGIPYAAPPVGSLRWAAPPEAVLLSEGSSDRAYSQG